MMKYKQFRNLANPDASTRRRLSWIAVYSPVVFLVQPSHISFGQSRDGSSTSSVQVVQSPVLALQGNEQSIGSFAFNEKLDLTYFENVALQNSPSLQRISALVESARGRGIQNATQANPQVGFNGQQVGSAGRAEQYGVEIGQEIIHRDKLALNRSIGEREANRLVREWQTQRQRILTDVRILFYRAARSERQLIVLKELLAISEQVGKLSEGLFKQGEASKTDSLLSELEVESSNLLLDAAINRQKAVWRELAATTGQCDLPIQPLAADLFSSSVDMKFEDTLCRIQQQSPEISVVLAAIERSRVQLQRQQIETRPNVTVQGLFNAIDNGIGGRPDGALLVTMPIPVWNKNRGGIQEARYQLIAAQRELNAVELELQIRLAPVFDRYSTARSQVERYRDRILPKSEKTLELSKQAYASGSVSFLSILTAQRAYSQNQVAYLESLETLRVAEAEIEGLLLVGSATAGRTVK